SSFRFPPQVSAEPGLARGGGGRQRPRVCMKQFNVGIIGYGWAATAHIDAINRGTGGKVTAVCSTRALDAAELTARHGAPIRVYREVEALLADPSIEVVAITGYPWEHAGHAVAAARAGKH